MDIASSLNIRPAQKNDARALAKLIDIAGEGIPHWLWSGLCAADQSPLDIGEARAQRLDGGFSYTNAIVAAQPDDILGMALSYPITEAPDDDPGDLPAPIAPFIELEAQSVGTWFVNALAVFPGHRGLGIGASLLAADEDRALAQGFNAMSIQAFEQNHGAVRLYRRLGYREQARSPVRLHPCQPYYTGSVLLLIKDL